MRVSRTTLLGLVIVSLLFLQGSSCGRSGEPVGADAPEESDSSPLRDRQYDAGSDSVWSAVLASYADLDMPIETVSPPEGRVRGQLILFPKNLSVREYLQCGSSGMLGDWIHQPDFKADYSLSTLVSAPEEGGMLVKSRATYMGKLGSNRIGCVSTGKLEQRFFKALEARLNMEARNSDTG